MPETITTPEICLKVLREIGHPASANSVFDRVRRVYPKISRQAVGVTLSKLAAAGKVEAIGLARERRYAPAPVKATVVIVPPTPKPSTNGTAKPEATAPAPPPAPPATNGHAPAAAEGVQPRAARVGQYTINTTGWIAADDQGARVVLWVNVLEIDGLTKHPVTKALKFDQPNELRLVREWLALQTGPHTLALNAVLEAERDEALQMALEAGERARMAEERLAAIRKAAVGE